MPRGYRGRIIEHVVHRITTDASGNSTSTVAFAETFVDPPHVAVVPYRNDAGTMVASAVTTTGCTLTVTSSDLRSVAVDVLLIAHEKL